MKDRIKKKRLNKSERIEEAKLISQWNEENKVKFFSRTKGLSALEQFNHYCDNTK